MKYFAYGSNMSIARIRRRCPSAEIVGVAKIRKYSFRLNKPGCDLSAKADAFWTGDPKDAVYGVVYEISREDFKYLDVCEGHPTHYLRRKCNVVIDGRRMKVWVYVAMKTKCKLLPLVSYMKHIINGAIENKLPAFYIDMLKKIKVQPLRKIVTPVFDFDTSKRGAYGQDFDYVAHEADRRWEEDNESWLYGESIYE